MDARAVTRGAEREEKIGRQRDRPLGPKKRTKRRQFNMYAMGQKRAFQVSNVVWLCICFQAFSFSPLHCIFGWHALHGFREHIDDNVLAQHLRSLTAGWPRIAH